jgi:hypothetical protein
MNFGHKVKLNMEYGSVRTPFPVPHTGYEEYLRSLNQKFNSWVNASFVKDKVEGLEEATEMMQQRYPGNYKLIEKYNSNRGASELAVEFDNPKEEMLWKMKWA